MMRKRFGLRILRVAVVMVAALALMVSAVSCMGNAPAAEKRDVAIVEALRDSLQRIADGCPGELGVAVITDCGDTILVNNETKYPLMSVFKLHQAVALCEDFERRGLSIDSVVGIRRGELNPDTWSPMLKDRPESVIAISVRDLLRYALMQSDNNASNYMFDRLQPVAAADSFVAAVAPRGSFRLMHTEDEMWNDHSLAYENVTSPLGAAILIDRLFTDSIVGTDSGDFIRKCLLECRTGADRIAAPLTGIAGVEVAHKTGSGYRGADGVLAAHNDVAHIRLPEGRCYTLAVFVKDFHGPESAASDVIARVSAVVYGSVSELYG